MEDEEVEELASELVVWNDQTRTGNFRLQLKAGEVHCSIEQLERE